MIKTAKHTKKLIPAISTLVTLLVLATTVFVSGVLANELFTDEYKIEVRSGDSLIELNNKPFMENGEVYLPLRETLTSFGALEHKDSKIEWDNGNIILELVTDETGAITGSASGERGIVTITFPYMLTIGDTSVYSPPRQHENGSRIEASYNFSLSNPPILKNGVTYVPFEFIQRIGASPWNFLEGLSLTVYDKDGQILYNVSNPKLWKDENASLKNDEVIESEQPSTTEKPIEVPQETATPISTPTPELPIKNQTEQKNTTTIFDNLENGMKRDAVQARLGITPVVETVSPDDRQAKVYYKVDNQYTLLTYDLDILASIKGISEEEAMKVINEVSATPSPSSTGSSSGSKVIPANPPSGAGGSSSGSKVVPAEEIETPNSTPSGTSGGSRSNTIVVPNE